jgi:large subunit ribosomal protein L34e
MADHALRRCIRHFPLRIRSLAGGKIVVHYQDKKSKGPACGDCGKRLIGIPRLRPIEYSRLAAHERTVSRAYGGSRCAGCTRSRIMRAFIVEEQKILKKLLLEKIKASKAAGAQ